MQPRLSVLLNPNAGARRGAELLSVVRELAHSGVIDGEVVVLDEKTGPQEIDQAIRAKFVVIAGGDGSISGLLPSLLRAQPIVVPWPLGTANDLARELGYRGPRSVKRMLRILKALREESATKLDIWRLSWGTNDSRTKLWLNYISFGFDAAVVKRFETYRQSGLRLPKILGAWGNRLIYLRSVISSLNERLDEGPTLHYASSGAERKLPPIRSIFFSNIRYAMGVGVISPSSNSSDGVLEALGMPVISAYLGAVPYMDLVCPRPVWLGSEVEWKVSFGSAAIPVQVDGEVLSDVDASHYRISHAGWLSFLHFR